MVDGGTIDLVRSLGVEVVSSAELIQTFEARWTPEALRIAPRSRPPRGPQSAAEAFALIRERTAQRRAAHRIRSEELRARRLRQGRAGHRPRPHRGRQRQRLEPALRAHGGDQLPDPARRSGCCSTCGPSSTSPARSTTTSPGRPSAATIRPTAMRQVFAVVTGARDAAIERVHRRHRRRASRCAASKWTTPAARDSERRLRRVFHASHRPFHRRGSARQRRQHGQFRESRRAPRLARGPASPSSPASICRISACAPKSICSSAKARRGSPARSSARWRCSNAFAGAGGGGDAAFVRAARQPRRIASSTTAAPKWCGSAPAPSTSAARWTVRCPVVQTEVARPGRAEGRRTPGPMRIRSELPRCDHPEAWPAGARPQAGWAGADGRSLRAARGRRPASSGSARCRRACASTAWARAPTPSLRSARQGRSMPTCRS